MGGEGGFVVPDFSPSPLLFCLLAGRPPSSEGPGDGRLAPTSTGKVGGVGGGGISAPSFVSVVTGVSARTPSSPGSAGCTGTVGDACCNG